MFTGIVEETGRVAGIAAAPAAIQLTISLRVCGRGLKIGDSLAVNGCCLTVAKLFSRGKQRFAQFDLLKETWLRTNLQFAKTGSLVNLERSLRADGRLGGHFVSGHVALGRSPDGKGQGRIMCWILPPRPR